MMAYLYLLSVFFLLLLAFFLLRKRKPVSRVRKPPLPTVPGLQARLQGREQSEMLEAARSMARAQPQKTAALLSQWIADDLKPPTKDQGQH